VRRTVSPECERRSFAVNGLNDQNFLADGVAQTEDSHDAVADLNDAADLVPFGLLFISLDILF
jgi:hypothetical protein